MSLGFNPAVVRTTHLDFRRSTSLIYLTCCSLWTFAHNSVFLSKIHVEWDILEILNDFPFRLGSSAFLCEAWHKEGFLRLIFNFWCDKLAHSWWLIAFTWLLLKNHLFNWWEGWLFYDKGFRLLAAHILKSQRLGDSYPTMQIRHFPLLVNFVLVFVLLWHELPLIELFQQNPYILLLLEMDIWLSTRRECFLIYLNILYFILPNLASELEILNWYHQVIG